MKSIRRSSTNSSLKLREPLSTRSSVSSRERARLVARSFLFLNTQAVSCVQREIYQRAARCECGRVAFLFACIFRCAETKSLSSSATFFALAVRGSLVGSPHARENRARFSRARDTPREITTYYVLQFVRFF